MTDKGPLAMDEAQLEALRWPILPDPVSEHVESIVKCIVEVATAVTRGEPILIDHPRLYDAFLGLYTRLLQAELALLRLQTKGHRASPEMEIAGRINRTLQRAGVDEGGIRAFWMYFFSEDGPTEPDAKRQAVSRAARKS